MRKSLFVLSLSVLAASALAQNTRPEKPFRVELGLFLPTVDFPFGIDANPGFAVGLGGDFYTKNNVSVGAEIRGQFYTISGFGDDATVSIGSLLATGRYRFSESKAFAGVSLGFGQGRVDIGGYNGSSDTDLIYSIEGGYDFSKAFYGLVRYQGSSLEGLRGFTVGVGFRF